MNAPHTSQLDRDAIDDQLTVDLVDRLGTGPHAIDSVEVLAQ